MRNICRAIITYTYLDIQDGYKKQFQALFLTLGKKLHRTSETLFFYRHHTLQNKEYKETIPKLPLIKKQ